MLTPLLQPVATFLERHRLVLPTPNFFDDMYEFGPTTYSELHLRHVARQRRVQIPTANRGKPDQS